MPGRDFDIHEMVAREVRQQLMFFRHYWGTVLSTADRLNVGRVQVSLPELRWTDQTSAPWCFPRLGPGCSVPAQGAVVEVYFVEGNPSRAVWVGRVPEQGEVLKNFSGPSSHVVFEDPENKVRILYDAQGNVLQIGSGTFAASARKGDATLIDVTTDPVNMAILTAITGIASLAGKVNAGSAQVQVGS